jgi:hypothetical protein
MASSYKESFQLLSEWIDKFNEDPSHGHASMRVDADGHFSGMTIGFRSMLELCVGSPIAGPPWNTSLSHHY